MTSTGYTYEQLMKLEDLYYQSLKANSITNPIQRESLRTLLKVLIDINNAIALHDLAPLATHDRAHAPWATQANKKPA